MIQPVDSVTLKGKSQEDVDADLARYRRVLSKVRDVLEDEDKINNIMNKYKQERIAFQVGEFLEDLKNPNLKILNNSRFEDFEELKGLIS